MSKLTAYIKQLREKLAPKSVENGKLVTVYYQYFNPDSSWYFPKRFAPGVTHAEVVSFRAKDHEDVFVKMQGHMWSPRGEAFALIEALELEHTSMSVGDVLGIEEDGKMVYFGCGASGWGEIEIEKPRKDRTPETVTPDETTTPNETWKELKKDIIRCLSASPSGFVGTSQLIRELRGESESYAKQKWGVPKSVAVFIKLCAWLGLDYRVKLSKNKKQARHFIGLSVESWDKWDFIEK